MRAHILDSPLSYYATFFVVRYVPTWFCYLLGRLVALIIYCFSRADREGLAGNLSVVLKQPAHSSFIRKMVRSVFLNYGQYMVDFFLTPQLSPRRVKELFSDIRGEEILKRALARGKGVIFLSAHVGNWEIGGSMLRMLGYSLTIVAMAHNTAMTNALVNQLRQDKGIKVISMDMYSHFSGIEILRHLRNNEIVAMNGDRALSGRGRKVDFFGKRVTFPVGPVLMAMKSGAALIPAFVIREGTGKYFGVLEEPISLFSGGTLEKDMDRNLALTARVFEKYVRRYPDQWYFPDRIAGKVEP